MCEVRIQLSFKSHGKRIVSLLIVFCLFETLGDELPELKIKLTKIVILNVRDQYYDEDNDASTVCGDL